MTFRTCVYLSALLLGTSICLGQPRPGYDPSSTHIFPAGGQRGTVVNVRVGAECIPPGTEFHLFGKGLSAEQTLGPRYPIPAEPSEPRKPTEIPVTIPREWQSSIEVSEDAVAVGYWRISCAQGGTGARPFIVGDLPEFIEQESNSRPDRAETVTLPVTINGQIYGERDVDYFRFDAATDDVVSFEVIAGRIGSRLDPLVEIQDLAGNTLRSDRVHVGSDPVLVFRSPRSGSYLLRIANVTFRGDAGHVYRINALAGPYLRTAFPAGGQSGTTRDVEFTLLNGNGEREFVRGAVTFPADGSTTFSWQDEAVTASTVTFAVDEHTGQVESEPNDAIEQSNPLQLPVVVDGRFDSRSDQDMYRIDLKANQRLALRCETFPRGLPTIALITLLDENGNTIAASDSIASADRISRLEWAADESTIVYIRARDLRFGSQGGGDFTYRLTAELAAPGFELHAESDLLNLMPGSEATVDVIATRMGGLAQPITLSVADLPDGVTVSDNVIPEGQHSTKLKLSASEDAASVGLALKITGTATVGQDVIEQNVRFRHISHDSEYVTVGASGVDAMQLTVRHKPLFRLYCQEAYQYAHRGTVFSYPMQVERLNDFDGEIHLQIGDRQNRDLDGIEMFEVSFPAGQSTTELPIFLPETMAINVQSQSQLYAQAWASFIDKHGREQSVLVLSEKRNMLRTLPPVVKLQARDEIIMASPGSTVRCRLFIDRTTNYADPMTIRLQDTSGVTCDVLEVAANASEAVATVRLAEDLTAAAPIELRFRGTGRMNGETLVITEAIVQLAIVE